MRDLICIKTSRLKKSARLGEKTSDLNNTIRIRTTKSELAQGSLNWGMGKKELNTNVSTIPPNQVHEFIWSRLTPFFCWRTRFLRFEEIFPIFDFFSPIFTLFLIDMLFLHLFPVVSPRPKHIQTPRQYPFFTTQLGWTHSYTFMRRSADFEKKTCRTRTCKPSQKCVVDPPKTQYSTIL